MKKVKLLINFFGVLATAFSNKESIDLPNSFLFPQPDPIEPEQIPLGHLLHQLQTESKESVETVNEVIRYESSFPSLPGLYYVLDGYNRTFFHHVLNFHRHKIALHLAQSIIESGSTIEDFLPKKNKLALEYIFSTDRGTPEYSNVLLKLTQYMLAHTKTIKENIQKRTVIEGAIIAQVHPIILEAVFIDGQFPINYDPMYSCSPLTLLVSSRSDDYYIEHALNLFSRLGVNFNQIAPCPLLMDQKIKITALNSLCTLKYQHSTESNRLNTIFNFESPEAFKKLLIRNVKILIDNYGADPSLGDGLGMPLVNTISYHYYLNPILLNSTKINLFEYLKIRALSLFITILNYPKTYLQCYKLMSLDPDFQAEFVNGRSSDFGFLILLITLMIIWGGLKISKDLKLFKIAAKNIEKKAFMQVKALSIQRKPNKVINKREVKKIDDEKEPTYLDFLEACAQGKLDICKKIYQEIFLNSKDTAGNTALMKAVQNGHPRIVDYLLNLGIDCNAVNQKGENALLLACEKNYGSFISSLISHRPLPQLKIKTNSSLVIEILLNKTNDDFLVKSFLNAYVKSGELSLGAIWGEKNDSLLIHLIQQGLSTSVEYIIQEINLSKNYSLFNYQNLDKVTAFWTACDQKKPTLAYYLLREAKNLKIDLPNVKGVTPRFKAIEWGHAVLANNIKDLLALTSYEESESKSSSREETKTPPPIPVISKPRTNKKRNSLPLEFEASTDTQPKVDEKKFSELKKAPPVIPIETKLYQKRNSLPLDLHYETKHRSRKFPRANNQLTSSFDNKKFIISCIKTSKYLIFAFSCEPKDESEKLSRHCQLVFYLINLLKIIANYHKYLNKMSYISSDKLIDDKGVRNFLNAISHSVLPQLLQGHFFQEIEDAISEIIKIFPKLLYDKIRLDGLKKSGLEDKELKEFCTMLGSKLRFVDMDTLPTFAISSTPLYNELYNFHQTILKLGKGDGENKRTVDMIPINHQYYVESFAISVIASVYKKISFETEYQYVAGLGQKPKKIIHWGKLDNFAPYWHQLIILLMSCGNIWIEVNSDLTQFIRNCRVFRNCFRHDKVDLINLSDDENKTIAKLCEQADNLLNKNVTKYRRLIVETLGMHGLFSSSTGIILDYLQASPQPI